MRDQQVITGDIYMTGKRKSRLRKMQFLGVHRKETEDFQNDKYVYNETKIKENNNDNHFFTVTRGSLRPQYI